MVEDESKLIFVPRREGILQRERETFLICLIFMILFWVELKNFITGWSQESSIFMTDENTNWS